MAADLHADVVDVIVRVTGCAPDDVVAHIALRDLGVDSLALVEIADELGRRIGGWLPDDVLLGVRSVGDLERAARDNRDTPRPAWARQAELVASDYNPNSRRATVRPVAGAGPASIPASPTAARRMAIVMGLIGALIGIGAGTLALMGTNAIGLSDFRMPPLAQPTVSLAPEEPTQTQGGGEGGEVTPQNTDEPTLTASSDQVSPGERFTLSGQFPGLSAGEVLQVQRRTPESDWEDFPVTPTTRDQGTFSTEIYDAQSGDYKFRLRHIGSGTSTPEVVVSIR